jgi:epoxyqueuosine reductase
MQELDSKLGKMGYLSRTVSIQHVPDLRRGIEGSNIRSLLNKELYKEYLACLSFKPRGTLPDAKSVIVVAASQPQIRLVFTYHGRPHQVIIPPTYRRETDKGVEQALSSILDVPKDRLKRAALPLKLLAVRSGLGDYGRNNICYVPGMGSFHRLVAYYTDLTSSEETWREPQMMERCQSCQACIHSCPTSAITGDRFLIHAERCITFHNERVNEFPAWIDSSWHNCLVGCLSCQKVCPENHAFLEQIEDGGVFSEQETNLMLNLTQPSRLPSETAKKLERVDMLEYRNVLGRNLRALFNSSRCCSDALHGEAE